MSKETKTLHSAFREKEQQQNLLSNLEKMRVEGTIAAEQYAALKHDYQQKMMAGVSQISHIKQELGAQLRAAMQELNLCQTELDQVRAGYAAGNLSPKEVQRSERKLGSRMENAGKEVTRLQALVDAKSPDQLVIGEAVQAKGAKARGTPPKVWAAVIPAIVILIGAGVLATWWAGLLPFGPEAPGANDEPGPPSPPYLAEAAELVKPSMVLIQTTSDNVTSTGSGVIIDADGYILTSRQVVEDAEPIQVFLYNAENDKWELEEEKACEASIVSRHGTADLAVIRIESSYDELPAATLGDSDSLEIGDEVLEVGYAVGDNQTGKLPLEAWGRVLAKPVSEDGVSYIQTDIAVNPGNRGGALVNSQGELVGIITHETVEIGGQAVQDINLAIAINYAKPLIEDLPGEH